jgi:hypothetical protein
MKVERQPHYCQEKERNQKINRSCQDLPKNLHYTNLTPKSLATNGVKYVIPGKIYSIPVTTLNMNPISPILARKAFD